jgi:peroxiredoxin
MQRSLLISAFLLAFCNAASAFQTQAPAACLDRPPAERPYSRVRLIDVVKSQTPVRAEYLIRACGVRVVFNSELEGDLREAGAEDNVIAAVREVAPKPALREPEPAPPASTPPPPAESRAPEDPVGSPSGLSNRRAPGWNLPDGDLNHYDVLDYRGRWLLLDFMITNCSHCKALGRVLEQVQSRYGGKVAVVSITIAPPETVATVSAFLRENALTTPILFDMGQVAAVYLMISPERPTFDTPHLFVIDPNGNIVRDWGYNASTKQMMDGPASVMFRQLDRLIQ